MFGDIRQCVSEIDSHFVNRYGTESLPTINLHNQLIHSQVMAFLKILTTLIIECLVISGNVSLK